jgi:hypothetical protein
MMTTIQSRISSNTSSAEIPRNPDPTSPRPSPSAAATFPRADASETADIGLAVEAGSDLAIWPEIYNIGPGVPSAGVSIQENAAAPDTITVTFPLNTAIFARLRVTVSQ